MAVKRLLIFLIFFYPFFIYPQVENVPADHPVYSFLKEMHVQGILEEYNDFIIPVSKEKVILFLKEIDTKKNKLSVSETGYLNRLLDEFISEPDEKIINIFDDFPSGLISNIASDKEKHVYSYVDSSIAFFINPVADIKYIYSNFYKNNSTLINYGGSFHGSYDNWLGFYLRGSVGFQLQNREVAKLDKRVAQSFTFNDTKLQYFDDTEGYLRLQKGIVDFQVGRERVLWGNGYIDKLLLSSAPPKFDFISFNLNYKSFSYNFLHGWLVHMPLRIWVDSLTGYVKDKPTKYMAISRLGFQPNGSLSLGVSQVVVYGNRPLELSYLNPFLYWESAQRSLNDLDNSYLSFDARGRITNGIELSGSIIFDDINLEIWSKGDFNSVYNRYAWQVSGFFANPILPKNISLRLEYLQLRPYIFSHYGFYPDALTYTTNGYFLGVDMHPNSARFSLDLSYRATDDLIFNFLWKHSLHGNNLYDSDGNLIRSYGGDVYRTITRYDQKFVALLEGEREVTNNFSFRLNYEITFGLFFDFELRHDNFSSPGEKLKETSFNTSLFFYLY